MPGSRPTAICPPTRQSAALKIEITPGHLVAGKQTMVDAHVAGGGSRQVVYGFDPAPCRERQDAIAPLLGNNGADGCGQGSPASETLHAPIRQMRRSREEVRQTADHLCCVTANRVRSRDNERARRYRSRAIYSLSRLGSPILLKR